MIQITVEPGLWRTARQHLDQSAEQVGFFLASWSSADRQFRIRSWQPVLDGAADAHGQRHVSLPDETRSAIIKWAWAEQACLIEAHSHGRRGPAAFSRYDLQNLEEWVPHLWWRLRGRPYAAIVTSARDLDALAWIDGPGEIEPVGGITADVFFPATGATRLLSLRGDDGRR
ncbi:MAG: hypothetical protein JO345_34855 [Streptosporangiaceae bacterium]|nr:hypothetical protein [Streptosporangiaceae bacterium]